MLRVIPFALFWLLCDITNATPFWMFYMAVGVLFIWEFLGCKIAGNYLHFRYKIRQESYFLTSILYSFVSMFSSYYYMGYYPFNGLCACLMFFRIVINSLFLVLYFVYVRLDITLTFWAGVYLLVYFLHFLTFFIWLYFKYEWLTPLIKERHPSLSISGVAPTKFLMAMLSGSTYSNIEGDGNNDNKNNKMLKENLLIKEVSASSSKNDSYYLNGSGNRSGVGSGGSGGSGGHSISYQSLKTAPNLHMNDQALTGYSLKSLAENKECDNFADKNNDQKFIEMNPFLYTPLHVQQKKVAEFNYLMLMFNAQAHANAQQYQQYYNNQLQLQNQNQQQLQKNNSYSNKSNSNSNSNKSYHSVNSNYQPHFQMQSMPNMPNPNPQPNQYSAINPMAISKSLPPSPLPSSYNAEIHREYVNRQKQNIAQAENVQNVHVLPLPSSKLIDRTQPDAVRDLHQRLQSQQLKYNKKQQALREKDQAGDNQVVIKINSEDSKNMKSDSQVFIPPPPNEHPLLNKNPNKKKKKPKNNPKNNQQHQHQQQPSQWNAANNAHYQQLQQQQQPQYNYAHQGPQNSFQFPVHNNYSDDIKDNYSNSNSISVNIHLNMKNNRIHPSPAQSASSTSSEDTIRSALLSQFSMNSHLQPMNDMTSVIDPFQSIVKYKYDEYSAAVIEELHIEGRLDPYYAKKVLLQNKNFMAESSIYNKKAWFNLFGSIVTQEGIQYHWRLKIESLAYSMSNITGTGNKISSLHSNNNSMSSNNQNPRGYLLIGVIDTLHYSQYVIANHKKRNSEYFAKSNFGYGININGNLKSGGKTCGKYCHEIKSGDIVDVYFDMIQYALWFGLNGNEYHVAKQVHKGFFKLAVAIFGEQIGVRIVSCDVYCYKSKNGAV